MKKLVWRNLMRNRVRSVLTIGSVAIGLLILTLLLAFLGAWSGEESSESRIVVRHATALTFNLPEAYGKRLENLDHIEAVTELHWFGGVYKNYRAENYFSRFGTDPETILAVFPEFEISEEQVTDFRHDRSGFLAGRALVDKHGWKVGDEIFIRGDLYPVDLRLSLRGIFRCSKTPTQENQILFHRSYVEEALGNPGTVSTYWLRLDTPDNAPAVIEAAEELFANSFAPVRAETEKAFARSFLEMLGNVRLLFAAISFALVVSILFVTGNSLAMTVRDRIGEIAVMRTLGFQRRHIGALVTGEATVVGVLGASLAVAGAWLLITLARRSLEEIFPIFADLSVSPSSAALVISAGVLLGAMSGLLPAFGAMRVELASGLRKVG